ncbi:hypothetical protein BJP40_19375 [Streptomyces sp. CC53]|uniref:hypothetical protein n=1 Tax=unclassified Streptomyces TaxID=2593676 RepID=UPI0008DE8340|nr:MULTISPECIES: hypothetical protein [unclassified Streptomyces]OII64783.1 hypothetical protein BJP40_19375 [Streptomyces sp. CC53]
MANGQSFEAATGDGPALPDPATDTEAARRRVAEVRVAYEGLLQIRRLTRGAGGDPRAVPADWERHQPVRAVALALEAGGFPPSAGTPDGTRVATGYRVTPGERPGTVRVEWLGPPGAGAAQDEDRALTACARTLGGLGWEALLYRGPRRRRFLEVEPIDATG